MASFQGNYEGAGVIPLTAARARTKARGAAVFTRTELVQALQRWRALPTHRESFNDDELADAITSHHLDGTICGSHDSRPVKFGAAYLMLTGRRLKL
jgi:hypothetical protein